MLMIRKPLLFFIICITTVFLIPFVFISPALVMNEQVAKIAVYFLVGELVLYGVWVGMFTNSNFFLLLLFPLLQISSRFMIAALSGIVAGLMANVPLYPSVFAYWLGNPAVIVIQAAVIIYITPYVLAVISPGVLTDTQFESILSANLTPEVSLIDKRMKKQAPAGPYQIYTLDDMTRFFNKAQGLEGFALYTKEGLPYIHNLPKNDKTEILGVRLQHLISDFTQTARDCDLEDAHQFTLETENYYVFFRPVGQDFMGLFIFNNKASLETCSNKVKILADSTRTFFKTRYPNV